jgi:chromosome segregation ATPase
MTDTDALLERLDYCGGRRGDGPDTNAWLEAATAIRELREQDRISSLLIRKLSGEASDFAEKLWVAEAERDNHGKAYEGAVENALRLQRDNDALHSAVGKLRVQHSAEVALLNADKDALRAEVETHFASLQREWKLVDELHAQLEAAQTMLRAASTELRKLKMTATADCIDAAIAAGVGK